jgi:NAD(P)H-hydrate epimerase
MSLTLTRQQVREVDRRAIADYGMTGLVLMENAGRGATDFLCHLLNVSLSSTEMTQHEGVANFHSYSTLAAPLSQNEKPSVVIVCGKGNNGGDGFVIARHLDLRGIPAKTLLLADPNELTGDAAANFQILQKANLPIEVCTAPLDVARFTQQLAGASWLVDALLGTGAIGEPKSPYAEAIDCMNAAGIPILAIDLPSGLDCDSGQPAKHTIRATATCTFVAAKTGFFTPAAAPYLGQLHIQDIGVPRQLLAELASVNGPLS